MTEETRAQNWQEAVDAHSMAEDAVTMIGDEPATEVWNALTGRPYKGDLADAVALTMPQEYVPLLRRASGIPAAFAVREIAKWYLKLSPTGDLLMRDTVNAAWVEFENRRTLGANIQYGLGWDLSSAWETVVEIADDPIKSRQIEAIAMLAGRMYTAMRGVKQLEEDASPQEVKDITTGGDIERLVASEHAQLGHKLLSNIAAMRLLKKQSTQFRMAGVVEVGCGPLVIVVDESGSMHDARNVWAKACVSALIRIAHETKRMVRVVHFSTATKVTPCKPGDRVRVLDALFSFIGGGTDIGKGIFNGIRQVGDLEKEGWTGADIVLVTDGGDGDIDRMQRAVDNMTNAGIRLWSVAIESAFGGESPLRKQAEKYVHVDGADLDSADVVKDLGGAAAPMHEGR